MKSISLVGLTVIGLAGTVNAQIVPNGDFETGGIAPAISNYALDNTMWPESTYNVVTHDTIHPLWVDFFDHTRGNSDGHFMIVNGTASGGGPAWAEEVNVDPDSDYALSAWFASLYPTAIASLSMRVYGVVGERGDTLLGSSDFFAPENLATWEERAFAFNSSGFSTVWIELWDTNQAAGGNDYAVDDIALTPRVPAPGFASLAGAAGLMLSRRRR